MALLGVICYFNVASYLYGYVGTEQLTKFVSFDEFEKRENRVARKGKNEVFAPFFHVILVKSNKYYHKGVPGHKKHIFRGVTLGCDQNT